MKKLLSLVVLVVTLAFMPAISFAQNPGLANYRNTGQTNAPVTIKASQGGVYGFTFINPNTSPVYVKFFNKGTTTVVGTDAPFAVIAVPPGNGTSPGMVYLAAGNVPWEYFLNAITVAATTGLADSSNTSPAVGLYTEVLFK